MEEPTKETPKELLERLLQVAATAEKPTTGDKTVDRDLNTIVDQSEHCKGVLTVLITLLTYKAIHPEQDIRYHQEGMDGGSGFSGRGFDVNHITPFMKACKFPAMSESGWLTRSLEQPSPYDLNYSGKIQRVKKEFLQTIDYVQNQGGSADACLTVLFSSLIAQRDSSRIALANPHHLPIVKIISYLEQHFNVQCQGSARLPVIAIYSAYECMMQEVGRYRGLKLLPLESHTSADTQSGRTGDIDVTDEKDKVFEAVEVKHDIKITPALIRTAYEKFKGHQIERYYLLTTKNMDAADWDSINQEIEKVAKQHGCQVIVNGVYSTLRYYLRLLKDADVFITRYIENMKEDPVIKFEHKEKWNKIVAGETASHGG